MGGAEGDTNQPTLSQLMVEGWIRVASSTNGVNNAKNHIGTASASDKAVVNRPGESSFHAEAHHPDKPDGVMVGDVGLDSSDMGTANSIICPTCNRAEGSLLTLRIHQVLNGHCYCKECKAFFLNDAVRGEHIDIVHCFACKECAKVFETSEKLQEHQVQSWHCYCKRCNCFFASRDDAVRHSATLHAYPCGMCKDVFRYSKDLAEHQSAVNHLYHCTVCNAKFGWGHELTKHVGESHTPCQCARCKYGFETAQKLREHQKPASDFYCMVCHKQFLTKQATDMHNEVVPHQSVICKNCGRHFLNGRALALHASAGLACAE